MKELVCTEPRWTTSGMIRADLESQFHLKTWLMTIFSVPQVICLQSHVRRWLAQEKVEQMRKERLRRLAWFQLQEKNHKEEQLRRRLNPQSRQDYDLLYSALESMPGSNRWGRGGSSKASLNICLMVLILRVEGRGGAADKVHPARS